MTASPQLRQQAIPSAWRGGEKALAIADALEGTWQRQGDGYVWVKGAGFAKPVLVELERGGLRLYNGANRTWGAYTKQVVPGRVAGKQGRYFFTVREEDLRELDGSERIDKPFIGFLEKMLKPGVFQKDPKPGWLIDVRDLRNFTADQLEIFDAELNPGWSALERSRHSVDRWSN